MLKLALIPAALLTMTPAAAQMQTDVTQATVPTDAEIESAAGARRLAELKGAKTWGALSDPTRFLLIMGAADGFSAAGPGSPCFPGKDNATLDDDLARAGLGPKDPMFLVHELAKLSSPVSACSTIPKRGYTAKLLKSMSPEHLSIYLSGLLEGYGHIKGCKVEVRNDAAAAAVIALSQAGDSAQPNEFLAEPIARVCDAA